MVTQEELNNARVKMLKQREELERIRREKLENKERKNKEVNNKEVVKNVVLNDAKVEKKARNLTKSESVSILVGEEQLVNSIRLRLVDLENNFYPTKSDIYRAGIQLINNYPISESRDLIKKNSISSK